MSDEFSDIIGELRKLSLEDELPKELCDRFGRYFRQNRESTTELISNLQLLYVLYSEPSPPMDPREFDTAWADIRRRAANMELTELLQELRGIPTDVKVPDSLIERFKRCFQRYPEAAERVGRQLLFLEVVHSEPAVAMDKNEIERLRAEIWRRTQSDNAGSGDCAR